MTKAGLRALRRRLLTPKSSEATLAVRGFHHKNESSKELLESIGRNFLFGFATAVEARAPAEAERLLETVPPQFRGFAYEGAGMGFATLDALPFGGGGRVAEFLAGAGGKHVYMVYVGVGWAMARVPRFRWPKLAVSDELLQWLLMDGYGFHQAYFHTEKYVHRHYREPDFPWPFSGPAWYANRAIDQGIGRALWFVGGADAAQVAELIDGFPDTRRADLYAGAGLAATYAGGAGPEELRWFAEHSGRHRAVVAQGSAFAAEARALAGLTVDHTHVATDILCGTGADEAVHRVRALKPAGPGRDDVPAYELWRRGFADQYVHSGGVEQ